MGRLLRRYKIDELPQLWNVLRGEMSLVGPRPELPHYVAGYSPQERLLLTVRPGITDPSTLAYVNEEEILANHDDPDSAYRTQILPDKLARSMDYLRQVSLASDLRIIVQTMAHVVRAARKAAGPESSPSRKGEESYSTKGERCANFFE
jgi:lipopolysaccharide/colanic/teichoic acid biosynthesis glycosyltransferase